MQIRQRLIASASSSPNCSSTRCCHNNAVAKSVSSLGAPSLPISLARKGWLSSFSRNTSSSNNTPSEKSVERAFPAAEPSWAIAKTCRKEPWLRYGCGTGLPGSLTKNRLVLLQAWGTQGDPPNIKIAKTKSYPILIRVSRLGVASRKSSIVSVLHSWTLVWLGGCRCRYNLLSGEAWRYPRADWQGPPEIDEHKSWMSGKSAPGETTGSISNPKSTSTKRTVLAEDFVCKISSQIGLLNKLVSHRSHDLGLAKTYLVSGSCFFPPICM